MPQHDDQKELQEASLLGRVLSMEAVLLLMGVVSLLYGLIKGSLMNIFWGVVIIPGVFLLHKVRKKDWKAHWAELEERQRLLRQREEERTRNGD